jgi:hypothetical protein
MSPPVPAANVRTAVTASDASVPLVLLVVPGSQLIVYPILWVLMPSE